jgi:hypothetical protein
MPAAPADRVLAQDLAKDLPLNGPDEFDLIEARPVIGNDELVDAGRDAWGAGALKARGDFARREAAISMVTVREYAHTLRPNWTAGSRVDFTETVYWNAGVKTDGFTGTATVSFNLSDSVTSFRVLADGFAKDGALGSDLIEIESVQPFSIEPKMPLQITSGDIIQLPVSFINGMSRELRGAEITANGTDGLRFTTIGNNSITLGAKERSRKFFQIEVGKFSGLATLMFDGRAGLIAIRSRESSMSSHWVSRTKPPREA